MIKRDIFVTRHGFQEPIQVVQGADMMPVSIHIVDYTIPSGCAAVAYNKRPDGDVTSLLCSIDGNVITFTPDASFFGEGYNQTQLRVTNDNKNLFSFVMDTWCYKNISSDDTEEINGNPTLLTQILSQIGELSARMEEITIENINAIISGEYDDNSDGAGDGGSGGEGGVDDGNYQVINDQEIDRIIDSLF